MTAYFDTRIVIALCIFGTLLSPSASRASEYVSVQSGGNRDKEERGRPEMPLLSPADSMKKAHVREGFTLQLVAAEPLVVDPVAIDWGADGRLWVAEMADYPMGIDGKGKPGGRVRYLEDTTGDGHYDKSTLFLEGIRFPTGILAWRDGVLVTAAPEIFFAEDRDGDGKADVRTTLFSGFLEGNQQLRVNGLRVGLDNWVYCASGSPHSGYGKESQIKSHLTGQSIQVGSRDFRIQPDTGLIEAQSGPSQYGRVRDDWGNWFGVQNSHPLWHYVLADHDIRRNPHFAPPDPRQQVVVPKNPPVYPAKKPQKRFHSFSESGRFTSACSPMLYRDRLLFGDAADHLQHAFTCEPFHNLVQHNLILQEGVSFRAERSPAEKEIDFFASADRWCRPVMVRTGPDGALWVVDMYRYMIEHPQWLPKQAQDELRPHYRAGDHAGRIYRIVPNGTSRRPIIRLDDMDHAQLIKQLGSANGWTRDMAQRLLLRQAPLPTDSISALENALRTDQEPLRRLHALCTLDGAATIRPELLSIATRDRHPGVRRQALKIAARWETDISDLMTMTDDPDPTVRLQLASTLGNFDGSLAGRGLAKVGMTSTNRFTTSSVLSSLNKTNVGIVFSESLRLVDVKTPGKSADEDRVRRIDFLSEVLVQVAAMGNDQQVADAIGWAAIPRDGRYADWQRAAIANVLNALQRRKWLPWQQLDDTRKDMLHAAIRDARAFCKDEKNSPAIRSTAVNLLLRDPEKLDEDLELVAQLLVPRSPDALQQTIVTHVAGQSDPRIAEVLLAGWKSHSPTLRSRIISTLASRDDWVKVLLDEIVSGRISTSDIDATMRQRLLATKSPELQAGFRQSFSLTSTPDRATVISQYDKSLKLAGNPARGKLIFGKKCSNCHRQENVGYEVGPNLSSLTDKSPRTLLASILDPSAAVEAKYVNYVLSNDRGRIITGILAAETASSLTLLAAEGKQEVILRNEIDELQSTGKSLMPDGLEKELTPQDMADVIAYVRGESSAADKTVSAHQKQLDERRQEYLNWIVDNFGPIEPTMKPLDGRGWALNQARLFLNKDIAKANRYFETVKLTFDADFMGIRLLKTLLDFGDTDRLYQPAKDNLNDIIQGWPMDRRNFISQVATWPPRFTENHDLMHLTIGLFSEHLREQNIQTILSEMRKSLRWRYERGFYEWGSHRYQMHYTNPLQILVEHAPTEDIRRSAEELFNIILAERALMSVGGYLGGPGMRSYDRRKGCDYMDNNHYDSFLPTVWLALGVSEPRFDYSTSGGLEPAGDGYGNGRDPRLNQDEAMFLATSRLLPHPIVYELLEEVSTRPELIYVGRRAAAGHPFQNAVPRNPRSHQIVYYYNTPHVSLGSLQYLPYAGKMSVSWSPPRFFSVMFPENPSQVLRTRLTDEQLNADEQSYDYVADRIVQHQNWLLAAGKLSASHGLTSRQIGRWDLFHVGRGLCAHVELPGGWHVFQVSDLDKYDDAKSFVDALTMPTIENGVAQGVTTSGDRVAVNLKTMSITINNVTREPQLNMLHDSALMSSEYGSGKISIRTKASHVTFDGTLLQPDDVDFPKLPPGQRRWGNPTSEGSVATISHARAMGGLSPQKHTTRLKSISICIPLDGDGTARVAVYVGGTLERGPQSGVPAKLLYDFGRTAKSDSSWLTLKHPGDGVEVPANTPLWLAWKGTANIVYQEYRESRNDFQTARGRWDSKAIDHNVDQAWPETWPADDGGGFDSAWYSCYLTLEQMP